MNVHTPLNCAPQKDPSIALNNYVEDRSWWRAIGHTSNSDVPPIVKGVVPGLPYINVLRSRVEKNQKKRWPGLTQGRVLSAEGIEWKTIPEP